MNANDPWAGLATLDPPSAPADPWASLVTFDPPQQSGPSAGGNWWENDPVADLPQQPAPVVPTSTPDLLEVPQSATIEQHPAAVGAYVATPPPSTDEHDLTATLANPNRPIKPSWWGKMRSDMSPDEQFAHDKSSLDASQAAGSITAFEHNKELSRLAVENQHYANRVMLDSVVNPTPEQRLKRQQMAFDLPKDSPERGGVELLNAVTAEAQYRKKHPKQRNPLRWKLEDFSDPNQTHHFLRRLPVAGHVAKYRYNREIADMQERIRNGTYSQDDILAVAEFINDAYEDQNKDVVNQAADVLSFMPAFIGEMALTGPVFRGASAGASRLLGEAATSTAGKASQYVASRSAGVAAQTLANPQMVLANAAERSMPEMGYVTNDRGESVAIQYGKPKDFLSALPAAFVDSAIELGSERFGGPASKASGAVGRAAIGRAITSNSDIVRRIGSNMNALRNAAAKHWLGKPGRTVPMLERLIEQGQWHGVIAEWMEERFGDAMRIATGLEDLEDNELGQFLTGRFGEAGRQALVEGIAFGIPGAANLGANLAFGERQVDQAQRIPPRSAPPEAIIVPPWPAERQTAEERLAAKVAEERQLEPKDDRIRPGFSATLNGNTYTITAGGDVQWSKPISTKAEKAMDAMLRKDIAEKGIWSPPPPASDFDWQAAQEELVAALSSMTSSGNTPTAALADGRAIGKVIVDIVRRYNIDPTELKNRVLAPAGAPVTEPDRQAAPEATPTPIQPEPRAAAIPNAPAISRQEPPTTEPIPIGWTAVESDVPSATPAQKPSDESARGIERLSRWYSGTIRAVEPRTQIENDAAEFLRQRGRQAVFVESPDNPEFARFSGAVLSDVAPNSVFLRSGTSPEQADSLWRSVGHELAHSTGFDRGSMADENLIAEYSQKRFDKATPKYQERMKADPDLYRREGVAELVGEFMSDPVFRAQLAESNPPLFKRLRDAILQLLRKFTPRDAAAREALEMLRQTAPRKVPATARSATLDSIDEKELAADILRELQNEAGSTPRTSVPARDVAPSKRVAAQRQRRRSVEPSRPADTQAALDAAREKAKRVAELIRTKLYSTPLDPELMSAIADMTAAYTKAGILTFRDFIREMSEVLGRDATLKAENYLRRGWDYVRQRFPDAKMDSSTPLANVLGDSDEHSADVSRQPEAAASEPVQSPEVIGQTEHPRGRDREAVPRSQAAQPAERDDADRSGRAGDANLAGSDSGVGGSERSQSPATVGEQGRGVSGGEAGSASSGLRSGAEKPAGVAARRRAQSSKARKSGDCVSSGNYRIDPAVLGQGGAKQKYRDNVAAIRLLKQIQSEGRSHATRDEQAILAKYVGWGMIPGVFNNVAEDAGDWTTERDEIKSLLNEAEWKAARASTVNAHYTSPEIVTGMWEMAGRMGFDGGRIIETSAGIGNFIGLQPVELAGGSRWTAVELDDLSGAMLKLLYPDTGVHVQGYQEYEAPDNFYDLAISNVPFDAETRILSDRRYRKFRPALHDYFFLKTIDKVRPGGLLMFITSTGTMDKANTRLREELASKADLVAAIRLPENTFGKNAGTAVVTDLIVLRRRAPGQKPHGPAWTAIGTVADPAGGERISINEYFVAHPDQVLGTVDRKSRMYAKGQPHVSRTDDFEQLWRDAIERLPENAYQPTASHNRPEDESMLLETGELPGQLVYRDGKIYTVEQSRVVEMPEPEPHPTHAPTTTKRKNAYARQIEIVRDYQPLRNAVKEVVNAQLVGRASEEREAARKALDRAYDKFVAAHGPVSARRVYEAVSADIDYDLVAAIEDWSEETQQATKGPFFSQDTIRPATSAESAQTPEQAIALSLNATGRLDVEGMAKMLGTDAEAVAQQLASKDLAFNDPPQGWVVKDEYLSGNVRMKLADAEIAAESDPQFRRNVDALKRVIPADIGYADIAVRPSSPWLGTDAIPQFAAKLLGGTPQDFDHRYIESTGDFAFSFSPEGERKFAGSPLLTEVWGTPRADFETVMQSLISQVPVKIFDTLADGSRVFNAAATEAVDAKVQELGEEFQDWIWADGERRDRLVRAYNDRHNATVPRKYDGSHLTFPGMAPSGTQMGNIVFNGLRPHQANAVWQGIVRGKGIFAHEVGTGKTAAMTATAMELRRLGLAHKPAIIVPDSRVDATAREILQLYPSARVLTAARGMTANKRKATVARIASGNWDVVVLTHENLRAMPVSRALRERYISEQLTEIEGLLQAEGVDPNSEKALKSAGRTNAVVKKLARMLTATRERLKAATDLLKDTGVTFEETGIDFLLVDEAHKFKSLPVRSRLGNVKGIPSSDGSDRAVNLEMIAAYLQENNGGRGLILATGTPITNSLAELYVMQRYVQRKELEQAGLLAFDAWAATFGEVVTRMEFDHAGGVSMQSRFSKFTNVPELRQFVSQDMDVVRVDDDQELAARISRPRREDVPVVVPGSDAQMAYIQQIATRAKALKGARPEKGGDNHLKIASDGTKAALDIRLVQDIAEDDDNKSRRLVENLLRIRRDVSDGTQLIFVEKGRSTDPVFDIGKDIITKLVAAGVPREKILDFRGVDSRKKDPLVQKLRSGQAWYAIGNTDTLGTGVNAQDYIAAIHHLEPAWTPEAIEQRNGRGWRQGNRNSSGKVQIYTYLTSGSLDSWRWQVVAIKARGIEEFMLGRSDARSLENEDAEDFSHIGFERMQALSSGNPLRIELLNIENDIGRLTRAGDRFVRQKNRIRDEIAREEKRVAASEGILADQKADQAAYERQKESDELFKDQSGKTYSERHEAAIALRDAYKRVKLRSGEFTLGTYRGFQVVADMQPVFTFEGSSLRPHFKLRGKQEYEFSGKSFESDDPSGVVTSIEYQLSHIGNQIDQTQQSIDNRRRSIEGLKQDLARPWRDRQKLEDKKKLAERLREAISDGRTSLAPAERADTSVAEQLQREADEGDEVTSPGFGLGAATQKVRRSTVHPSVQAQRPEVEARLVDAHGVSPPSIAERIKEFATKVWHVASRTREHLPNTRPFDAAREILRLMDAAGPASADEALRTVAAILDPLDEAGRKVFERKVLVDNLRTAVERGQPLRFGFKDLPEVIEYQQKVDAVVALNPAIQKALDNRKRVVKQLVDELVAHNLLDEAAADNAETYFHQQVLMYVQASRSNRLGPRPKKRGFQKRRVMGPEEMSQDTDYNTSYIEAESEWIADAMAELRKEKLLAQLAKIYDKLPELRAAAKKAGIEVEQLLKQRRDLTLWQPVPGNVFYRAFTIPEKLAEEVLRGISDTVTKEQIRTALAIGGPRPQMALPTELAEQLQSMQSPRAPNWLEDQAKKVMNLWKWRILLGPDKAIGYMARNLTGDIDPVLAARPSVAKYTNRAIGELWRYYSGRLALTASLRNARDTGVIYSSLTAQEVPKIKELPIFRRLYVSQVGVAAQALDQVKQLNEFRESILRYAAYLDYLEDLKNNKLTDYGAANPKVVEEIRKTLGNEAAAAHLARHLLGDYGDITVAGQYLRTYVIPFYSWMEVNAKRWPRFAMNAFATGGVRGKGNIPKRVLVTGVMLARLATWTAMMHAWNWLLYGDDEEELGPSERATPHLLFGRRPDGSIRILRHTGALGDFLEWFGVNSLIRLFRANDFSTLGVLRTILGV